jgi:hypothetical protein
MRHDMDVKVSLSADMAPTRAKAMEKIVSEEVGVSGSPANTNVAVTMKMARIISTFLNGNTSIGQESL